ncbi:MAG: hypothetical protein CVT62_10030 [Actinobacteria bacterium HGW-Actinobacteria-2]|nr:MAG: hypothetical protein CVT62_10030 [Actinobacteria bacterium HGW-Actinobacteria-2]
MAKSFGFVLSAALAVVLVAGCAPADPAGQPTYSCTPEVGGTPYPCYKVQRDELNKLDALYAEAEAVYRTQAAEDERISRAGGVDEATPVMLETLSGTALTQTLDFYRSLKRDRIHMEGGAYQVVWIKRQPEKLKPGMAVAIQVCVDPGAARIVQAGSRDESVDPNVSNLQLATDQGVLKIAQADGDSVRSC